MLYSPHEEHVKIKLLFLQVVPTKLSNKHVANKRTERNPRLAYWSENIRTPVSRVQHVRQQVNGAKQLNLISQQFVVPIISGVAKQARILHIPD